MILIIKKNINLLYSYIFRIKLQKGAQNMNRIILGLMIFYAVAGMYISIGHTEMYLDSNGKAGIGTNTPLAKLDIYSPTAITDWWPWDAYILRLESGNVANPLNTIQIIKSYGIAESELRFDNGNIILGAIYTLSDNYSLNFLVGSIGWNHVTFEDPNNIGDLEVHLRAGPNNEAALAFNNSPDVNVAGHVSKIYRPSDSNDLIVNLNGIGDVMTFSSLNGNVGIGTTSPSQRLYVAGNIYAEGSITPGSSRELKENIRELSVEEAITALHGLYPQKFYYKADGEDEHVGFIAEDVPELVATKDRKGVDPMDVVAVLTKVVQEQQEIITKLSDKVQGLKECTSEGQGGRVVSVSE
jgi:hypothetical protein